MDVHKLTTSGPALAALLKETSLLRGAFDGLLLGDSAVRTESTLHDIREETSRDLLEVHISSFCCCSGLGSFYNAAGDIEAEEVSSIAQAHEGRFLGWFVHHCGPHRAPTIRERAVTAALALHVPPDIPVLFALVNSTLDSDKATASFNIHFLEQDCRNECLRHKQTTLPNNFNQEPGTVMLRPLDLQIENIGSSKRSRDYRPLRSALLPRNSHQDRLLSRRQHAGDHLIANSQQQTAELEAVYEQMLQQLSEASHLAASELADLKALQHEVDVLLMSTTP